MTSAHRRGFTLIEVVVGLLIMALVVVLARATLEAVTDAELRVAANAGETDRRFNGAHLLRTVVGSVIQGDSTTFSGSRLLASFTSMCPSAGGWAERCDVQLAVRIDSAPALLLSFGATRQLPVRVGFKSASLLYLNSAETGGQWLSAWAAPTAPLAIGLVVEGDTIIVPTGAATW